MKAMIIAKDKQIKKILFKLPKAEMSLKLVLKLGPYIQNFKKPRNEMFQDFLGGPADFHCRDGAEF